MIFSPATRQALKGYRMMKPARQPITHEVKAHPESFNRIISRRGEFDIRKNDRADRYNTGDTLRLREWLPNERRYTGRVAIAKVRDIIWAHTGLTAGYIAMGIFFEKMVVEQKKEIE